MAGACLSLVVGFPTLHIADPEPPEFWLPIVALLAVGAVMLVGYSARRRVLTEERQFVTDYLLFGRLCWWRRRWQVREGDYLAVFLGGPATPELPFWNALFVCRSLRRHVLAGMYTSNRVAPDMEIAAQRVARLADMRYEGCRDCKGCWWPFYAWNDG